jgi:hypothetical protein
VQHAAAVGDAVDGGMDEERRRLDLVAPGDLVAEGVDQHDVVASHLAPQQPARIEQEVLVAVERDAEVVADALGQPVMGSGAQREREVVAQLADGGAFEGVEECGGGRHGPRILADRRCRPNRD